MSFGMFLLAFFVPPIYFLVRRRILAALVNGCLYCVALITLLLFGLGVFVWILCMLHAFWDLRAAIREKEMRRQADLLAQRSVEVSAGVRAE